MQALGLDLAGLTEFGDATSAGLKKENFGQTKTDWCVTLKLEGGGIIRVLWDRGFCLQIRGWEWAVIGIWAFIRINTVNVTGYIKVEKSKL